jgi:hypothetical protein
MASMDETWQPIERTGRLSPEGVDEQDGRVILHFPLSDVPPARVARVRQQEVGD